MVSATLQRWRERGDRELPWLAGPAFTALGKLRMTPPHGEDVTAIERFLIGAETDQARVSEAIAALGSASVTVSLPPDFRGALVESVDRFFELLGEAYGAISDEVLAGHRRTVDTLADQWQERLDEAAHDIQDRIHVLIGARRPAASGRKPRRHPDRVGVAVAFVVIALAVATTVLWMVLQGWPMQSIDFGI